jgi:hypothetical protein
MIGSSLVLLPATAGEAAPTAALIAEGRPRRQPEW